MSSEKDWKRGFEETANPLFLPSIYKYYLISRAMTVVRLSQKGQMTIDNLGLETGDRLDVICKIMLSSSRRLERGALWMR